MIGFLAVLTVAYVAWRWGNTLPPFALTPRALWAWLFFALEMVAVAFDLWAELHCASDHSAEADALGKTLCHSPTRRARRCSSPTFNESLEILEPTIVAALRVDYPSDRFEVCVLDDGRALSLRAPCERLGVCDPYARGQQGLQGGQPQ